MKTETPEKMPMTACRDSDCDWESSMTAVCSVMDPKA